MSRVRDVDTLNLSFRVSPAVTILIQPETTVPEIPQEMLDNVSTISRKNQKELDIRVCFNPNLWRLIDLFIVSQTGMVV